MSVNILYFASLRESLGTASERCDLPADVRTAGQLRDWLIVQGRAALGSGKQLRVAVNQDMATPDTPVADGDEVAFFPPVTGG